MKSDVVVLRLDNKVKEILKAHAQKTGRSVSDLIKEAIAHYWLERIDKQKNSPVLK